MCRKWKSGPGIYVEVVFLDDVLFVEILEYFNELCMFFSDKGFTFSGGIGRDRISVYVHPYRNLIVDSWNKVKMSMVSWIEQSVDEYSSIYIEE